MVASETGVCDDLAQKVSDFVAVVRGAQETPQKVETIIKKVLNASGYSVLSVQARYSHMWGPEEEPRFEYPFDIMDAGGFCEEATVFHAKLWEAACYPKDGHMRVAALIQAKASSF